MGSRARANFAPELVTATNDGLNEVVVRGSLTQRLYLGVQIVVLDDPARPDPAHQLVFTDDRSVGLDQHQKHIESTPTEFQRATVGENFAALRQDPKATEFEARRRFGYGIDNRRL